MIHPKINAVYPSHPAALIGEPKKPSMSFNPCWNYSPKEVGFDYMKQESNLGVILDFQYSQ
jgi:hypothetical protein